MRRFAAKRGGLSLHALTCADRLRPRNIWARAWASAGAGFAHRQISASRFLARTWRRPWAARSA
ncbi:hypothetical protein IWW55_004139 [Coemansia sp. RSA 2706]|nr:hypothetical protein IWW55_004139 [Coemansia sp. RSA 2706]